MAYSFVTLHALYLLSKTEIDKASHVTLLSLTQTQSLLLPHLARMLGQSRAQAFRRMREYLTLCGPPRCREQGRTASSLVYRGCPSWPARGYY